MATNDHADDQQEKNSDSVALIGNPARPLVEVVYEFRDPPNPSIVPGPTGGVYRGICPHCELRDFYDESEHPRVGLGGISRTDCMLCDSQYYIMLHFEASIHGTMVITSRQELINSETGEITKPLIPEEVSPKEVDEVAPNWSEWES